MKCSEVEDWLVWVTILAMSLALGFVFFEFPLSVVTDASEDMRFLREQRVCVHKLKGN